MPTYPYRGKLLYGHLARTPLIKAFGSVADEIFGKQYGIHIVWSCVRGVTRIAPNDRGSRTVAGKAA